MRRHSFPKRARRGFTLIEVLVALMLLLGGVVAIVQLFPVSLKANSDAALNGAAALLAQQKVEEMRRDRDRQARIIRAIKDSGGVTDPIAWAQDPRLTYSYSGVSLYSDVDTPGDPRDDLNVARVVVRLSKEYDPRESVVYELRFDR